MLARKALRFLCLTVALGPIVACERGPEPAPSAQELSSLYGLPPALAQRLAAQEPLSQEEVHAVAQRGEPRLLAQLAAHPSVSSTLLVAWASYPDDVVRTAVAAQPRTPPETLRSLRVAGRPHPINAALAGNAATPVDLLLEMRARGEAGDFSLAANPSLPHDVIRDIYRRGDESSLRRLARNPALPADLREAVARHAD